MSPVDQAGPVFRDFASPLNPFLEISMFLYERVGCLGWIFFPYEHFSPLTG